MAVFGLVALDAKTVEPLAIIAVAGVAGYFLWQHLQQQNAAAQPSQYQVASNETTAQLENLQQLSLLQDLTGFTGNSGTAVTTSQPTNTAQNVIPIIGATGSLPASNTSAFGSSSGGSSV